MRKKISFILIFLLSSICFGQKIKTITEFRKEKDTLIKIRTTEFNKSRNLTEEIYFGGYDEISQTFRNKRRIVEYEKKRRVSEYNCEEFVSKDTCVVRSFSTYQFNSKSKIEKETKYESDSLIRFIREIKKGKRKQMSKTYSWEFSPTKNPNLDKAFILTDTIFYDRKNRILKRVNYNNRVEKPYIQLYKYSKKKYSYQIIGTSRDTTLIFKYVKMQKLADKKKVNYQFKTGDNYIYEIKYH